MIGHLLDKWRRRTSTDVDEHRRYTFSSTFVPSSIFVSTQGLAIARLVAFVIVLALLAPQIAPPTVRAAEGDVVNCTASVDLSNSEGYTSVDPFLLSDPSGVVHLFWAERKLGRADATPDVPDSLMYAVWDGAEWSDPVDIFVSPTELFNRKIAAPRAVLDDTGRMHLVWIGPDNRFFYSSALASEAGSARAWREPVLMDDDHSGTQYSVDIAYEAPDTIHIIYGSGTGGAVPTDNRTNRAITYTRSTDGGETWSRPVDIYTFSDPGRGASNTRLLVDGSNIYTTWTEWDATGNGQVVYFARSTDSGETWEQPVELARRVGDEYERDWTNLAVLGDDQLIAFWEGGFRAYPQAQYSNDGGQTWSEPIDTLYWLIADNGYAEFVRDSGGRLHLFIARRIREGYDDKCDQFPGCEGTGNAIWHSVWQGGTGWSEPKPVGDFSNVNFVTVAISGGNTLFAGWFDYFDFEINMLQCEIEGAPSLPPHPWPTPTPELAAIPTIEPTPDLPTPTPEPTPIVIPLDDRTPTPPSNPAVTLAFGIAPAILIISAIVLVHQFRRRRK